MVGSENVNEDGTASMLRSIYLALATVAFLALTFLTGDARAGDVGSSTGAEYLGGVFEPLGSFNIQAPIFGTSRFYGAPFPRAAVPAGVGPAFPYSSFYGYYPADAECIFERVPVKSIYGLGWRNFIVCDN